MLDDYHVLDASEVHEAVIFLLDHLPPQLHLVVATRSDPPLPLARLRSRGQLTEVRAADLRFTASEAREFLNQVMGLELTTADVAALEERTEGWIAGLQLAALSLRDIREREEVAGFIEAFTGSHRFVIDYLADEVLARQPVEIRDFLLRTAVLDRLTGSLCDAVTAGADGSRTLEALERGNLFVVPLDDQRSWYRYHHLFADVLGARLLAEHPDEVPDLHRRASEWYATHDLPIRAVRHALAAEDFDRAAYLMEGALSQMRRARQDNVLLTWIAALPESVVRRSPVLCIVSAWSHLLSGDLDAMEGRLDDAEAALAAGEHDPELARAWADTEDLRTAPATISVYRASLAQARGDVTGTVHHARRALDLAGPEDHFIRGAGGGYLGLAAWAAGNVAEALDTFGAAVRSLHAAGNLVDELDATIVLADMWVASGRPSSARQLYERALQTATAGGEPYPRATADLHVGLAELDRERDDLPTAEVHLETARVLAERTSITENRHRWYVAMAQVRAAAHDFDAAIALLDEAEALFRPGFYVDVRPIAAMRARAQIAHGDLAAAHEWAREHDVATADETAYLREYEHLTRVRLLLAPSPGDRDAHTARRRARAAGPAPARRRVEPSRQRGRDRHVARPHPPRTWAATAGPRRPGAGVGADARAGELRAPLPRRRHPDARPPARRLPRRQRRARRTEPARPPSARRCRYLPPGRPDDRPGRAARPTQRPRARGAAAPRQRADRTADRPRALRLAQHAAYPHQAHLHQAGRQHPGSRRTPRPRTRAPLVRPPAPSARVHIADHIIW